MNEESMLVFTFKEWKQEHMICSLRSMSDSHRSIFGPNYTILWNLFLGRNNIGNKKLNKQIFYFQRWIQRSLSLSLYWIPVLLFNLELHPAYWTPLKTFLYTLASYDETPARMKMGIIPLHAELRSPRRIPVVCGRSLCRPELQCS